MKILVYIVIVVLILFLAYFIFLGVRSKSGDAIGVIDGKLAQCPDKPNCVCSEYKIDSEHYVEPIDYKKGSPVEIAKLKNILIEMGATIKNESGEYLSAEFSSSVFGFVDDLEIRVAQDQNRIHFRSASRVGYSDLKANIKRVQDIKSRLNEELFGRNTD